MILAFMKYFVFCSIRFSVIDIGSSKPNSSYSIARIHRTTTIQMSSFGCWEKKKKNYNNHKKCHKNVRKNSETLIIIMDRKRIAGKKNHIISNEELKGKMHDIDNVFGYV